MLVDFWATWCGPCVASMPEVKRVYEKYRNQGLEIVGISLDKDRATLSQFLNDYEIPWPQYFDGKGWDCAIARKFGVQSIPTVLLVDKKGVLRRKATQGLLEQQVAALLDE